MIRKILKQNMADYKELTDVEQQYMKVLEQQMLDDIHSTITERKMKEATFLNYARGQVRKLKANGASDKEVLNILESMMPIAERRDKGRELKQYMEDFENGHTQENDVSQGEMPYVQH